MFPFSFLVTKPQLRPIADSIYSEIEKWEQLFYICFVQMIIWSPEENKKFTIRWSSKFYISFFPNVYCKCAASTIIEAYGSVTRYYWNTWIQSPKISIFLVKNTVPLQILFSKTYKFMMNEIPPSKNFLAKKTQNLVK